MGGEGTQPQCSRSRVSHGDGGKMALQRLKGLEGHSEELDFLLWTMGNNWKVLSVDRLHDLTYIKTLKGYHHHHHQELPHCCK